MQPHFGMVVCMSFRATLYQRSMSMFLSHAGLRKLANEVPKVPEIIEKPCEHRARIRAGVLGVSGVSVAFRSVNVRQQEAGVAQGRDGQSTKEFAFLKELSDEIIRQK